MKVESLRKFSDKIITRKLLKEGTMIGHEEPPVTGMVEDEDAGISVAVMSFGKIIGEIIVLEKSCVVRNPRTLVAQPNPGNNTVSFIVQKMFEEPTELSIPTIPVIFDVNNPAVLRAYRESVTGIVEADMLDLQKLKDMSVTH
jgi:hypothetical protein